MVQRLPSSKRRCNGYDSRISIYVCAYNVRNLYFVLLRYIRCGKRVPDSGNRTLFPIIVSSVRAEVPCNLNGCILDSCFDR